MGGHPDQRPQPHQGGRHRLDLDRAADVVRDRAQSVGRIDDVTEGESACHDDRADDHPGAEPADDAPCARAPDGPGVGDHGNGEQHQREELDQRPQPDQRVGGTEAAPFEQPEAAEHHQGGEDVVAEEERRRAGRQRVGAVGPGARGALPPPDGEEAEDEEGRHAEGEAILAHRRWPDDRQGKGDDR